MDRYTEHTLHGILSCKCKGNCLLKSMEVEGVENETAYINIEPFDDAFNQSNVDETIDRAKRMLLKRKKAIQKNLGVVRLSVTAYDEWTMKDAFVVDLHSHKIISSVN